MSWRTPLGTALALAAAAVLVAAPRAGRAEEEYEVRWSATLEAALKHIASEEADDDVTGFFDRYDYTPNKSSDLPVEIGVSDAAVDVLGEAQTPRLQFRLESPTSNLGVSGRDADRPFLNQRADLFGRLDGLHLDVAFRRLRTERLRSFPNPGPSGQNFFDFTAPDDRFYRERTGFQSALRLRPHDYFEASPGFVDWLAPQVSLRGGADFRDGERQLRFALPETNQWVGFTRDEDQSVGNVGGGVLAAPGGWFTVVLDVDHERFREDASAPIDAVLGAPFPASTNPIGFVPDTDRTTGSVRLQSRLGERAVIEGGFQVSRLQQVASETIPQELAGLDDNELLYTSANAAADVALVGPVSANGFVKFDRRDNEIDRDTALFNPLGTTQSHPFLDRWKRLYAGAELVYRLRAANLFAIGARTEWVDRDLGFVAFDPGGERVLPPNTVIADESESYTVYWRTVLRPLAALGVRGEVGYREAPETGYVTELDDYVYGKLRASYTVPLERPVLLTLFGQGGSGKNDDFSWVGGEAPGGVLEPTGQAGQDFERWDYRWGLTAATSPVDDVSLFASFFHSRGAQDQDLVLSSFTRYLQHLVPVEFDAQSPFEYRANDFSVMAGTHAQLTERTDAGLSYTFTRAEAYYRGDGTLNAGFLRDARRVDTDIHRLSLEAGHRLSEGLRLSAGYRLDYLADRSPVRGAVGSVAPFDLDTFEHTATVGVTFTNAFFD